uniref:Uncharacterized protein n=1 Tax=viral metagenome TaxID=1070528 RepID=A0A6M3LTC3_9ZZZZ
MNTYKIYHSKGNTLVEADSVEEKPSHFVFLRKASKSSATVIESERVAFCPKDCLIVKTG